eukprot:CAMPEP_0116965522 /NCGR_PEP_ID=MMETSP0467-20121206/49270_1 /TAXON_ID=283647 /ORGANISM="Mesodinium pulex, Strain SPMC105" /LENGTH=44 /DNA_ID= /DNA_START= /DNA_END= /DNA_ORIENTATION=
MHRIDHAGCQPAVAVSSLRNSVCSQAQCGADAGGRIPAPIRRSQ